MELNWKLILLYESVLETRDRLSKFGQVLGHIINGRLKEYEKDSVSVKEPEDWLPEQLKTIRNLCDTALLAIESKRRELLPTILELIYEQAQTIVDEECVIGEAD